MGDAWGASSGSADPYDQISAWRALRANGSRENPYRVSLVLPTTCFLYENAGVSPQPRSHAGQWHTYPSVSALANHLRYDVLEQAWTTWICQELGTGAQGAGACGVDPPTPRPFSLDEICAQARLRGASPDDLACMERVFGWIANGTWESIGQAVHLFNDRWRPASAGGFSLRLFSSPLAVGKHLWKNDVGTDVVTLPRAEWLALCERSVDDAEASARFLSVLARARGG